MSVSCPWTSCLAAAAIRDHVDVIMVDIDNNNQVGAYDDSQVEENCDRDDVKIVEAQAQVTQVVIRRKL